MVKTVNMHQAKTSLSALVRDLRTGAEREIILAIDGTPAAKIIPYSAPRRSLGMDQGFVKIADDFDSPNAEIAKLFEGAEPA